jgi:hypothetical protein
MEFNQLLERRKQMANKKMAKGDSFECEVCGLAVTVDELCGCVDVCDIICCSQPMKARASKPKKAKAKAKKN